MQSLNSRRLFCKFYEMDLAQATNCIEPTLHNRCSRGPTMQYLARKGRWLCVMGIQKDLDVLCHQETFLSSRNMFIIQKHTHIHLLTLQFNPTVVRTCMHICACVFVYTYICGFTNVHNFGISGMYVRIGVCVREYS